MILSCKHTSYVDSPCQGHISFPNSTEKSTVMHQPSDSVVDNNLSQVLIVQNVRVDKGTCVQVKKNNQNNQNALYTEQSHSKQSKPVLQVYNCY